MHNVVDKLILIEKEIKQINLSVNTSNKIPTIIAVSKTFPISNILPLINYGYCHFGENKIQEAREKWTDIKNSFPNIKLHMIGKLQTNKVKFVIPLFDYIHSLDNIKLAEKISTEQDKINRKLKIFIQINIGNEDQKSGINEDQLEDFYKKCTQDLNLDIIGLMCLPPKNEDTKNYFIKMLSLSKKVNVNELSMGMSNDYLEATKFGSTFLRIGSKIFGQRN